MHLNTSNVNVNQTRNTLILEKRKHLNTSNVNVNQAVKWLIEEKLNLFKYI